MNVLELIKGFFEWLSYFHLYPFYEAWNVTGVVLFGLWLLIPFLHLRKKLGFLKGGFFSCLIAFTWISTLDEIGIFFNMGTLFSWGWQLSYFFSRWLWKTFFIYFTLKYSKKYGILGNELRFTKISVLLTALYVTYYVLVPYRMFAPYNFRVWRLTEYPRWYMFLLGHFSAWSLNTVIYLSLWKFKHFGEEFLSKWGMGEAYMLYALKKLFREIRKKYKVQKIGELLTNESSLDFPDRDWSMAGLDELKKFDLIFVFRALSENMKDVAANSTSLILMASTNKRNFGYFIQRILKVKGEHYASLKELKSQAESLGLEVLETGYYDCPPWPDHSPKVIVPTKRLGISLYAIRRLTFLEHFKNRYSAHHAYVLARKS